MSGKLQAVDIFRTNSKQELQDKADKWYEEDYLVLFEEQSYNVIDGQYVLIAYIVSDRREIF